VLSGCNCLQLALYAIEMVDLDSIRMLYAYNIIFLQEITRVLAVKAEGNGRGVAVFLPHGHPPFPLPREGEGTEGEGLQVEVLKRATQ
jgi:hypothetical protein